MLAAELYIQVLCLAVITCIALNTNAVKDAEQRPSVRFQEDRPAVTTQSSIFSPESRIELKQAVTACLELSPDGDCYKGPHGHIGEWDVSKIIDMRAMFAYADYFNANIWAWDVSTATTMSCMFLAATLFNSDISKWDVSRVTDMSNMFRWVTSSFDSDISKWDVSSVANMANMFSNTNFNGDISKWDVSSVTNMANVFATASFGGDVSKWDVSSATDMDGMFWDTVAFDSDISKWDVSSVTRMSHMFAYAIFNGDISKWDVSSVTDMRGMFMENVAFTGDISKWDVSRVTDMSRTFRRAELFNVDISNWNVSSVEDMDYMFAQATSFQQKLCGRAWIHSDASKENMFLAAVRAASPMVCGSTPLSAPSRPFTPQSGSELKSSIGGCLQLWSSPRIIAHRGGSKIGPENTKGSLRNALEMDVDGIEFDIQLTGDEQLVVLHDDTLERTAVPYSRAKGSLPETMQEVLDASICLNICTLMSLIQFVHLHLYLHSVFVYTHPREFRWYM